MKHCETCSCPDPYPVAPDATRCTEEVEPMVVDLPSWAELARIGIVNMRCRLPAGHGGPHRDDRDRRVWQTVERKLAP